MKEFPKNKLQELIILIFFVGTHNVNPNF